MMSRYLLVSFFGGLIGAGCVLLAVYVTNARALVITTVDINVAVSSLHSRINDFYIFAGIVITLLLAINLAVFIKADVEVDRYIRDNIDEHKKRIEDVYDQSCQLLDDLRIQRNVRTKFKPKKS